MKPVKRSELLDLGAYEQVREHFRARVLGQKKARYVALGPNMTALFENHDSVLYQIQEMLRTERITSEKAILHELETYNELVPTERELSATIFVEYPDKDERDRMLSELAGLEDKFYLSVGAERLGVIADERGTNPSRTMAVQYVKFPLSEAAVKVLRSGTGPVALGVDHPRYRAEASFTKTILDSLREDFED